MVMAVRFPCAFAHHTFILPFLLAYSAGSAVAKYAGEHVHQRLVSDGAYSKGHYSAALKNAFLGTDQDIRTGIARVNLSHDPLYSLSV